MYKFGTIESGHFTVCIIKYTRPHTVSLIEKGFHQVNPHTPTATRHINLSHLLYISLGRRWSQLCGDNARPHQAPQESRYNPIDFLDSNVFFYVTEHILWLPAW